jgi:hypothetical protein
MLSGNRKLPEVPSAVNAHAYFGVPLFILIAVPLTRFGLEESIFFLALPLKTMLR